MHTSSTLLSGRGAASVGPRRAPLVSLALALAALPCLHGHAAAQTPFAPGNLVVVRVGDGAAALSNAATAVFLEEYTQAGASVQTIALPALTANQLTMSGTATSEGFLTASADGQFLLLAGYRANAGTAGIAATTSAAVARAVARVALNGTIDLSTALTDAASGSSVRSAVSDDGTQIWVAGGAGGVRFAPLGASTSTQVSTTLTNTRVLGIHGGQLYVSSSSGAFQGVSTVGAGLPSTTGNTITLLPGFPTAAGPSNYDFWFADANTVYVADDRTVATGGGLQKWTFNGSSWTLAYTMNTGLSGPVRAVTGVPGASPPRLFATTTDSPARLVEVTDNGSNAGSPFTTRATVGTNRVFRGLRYLPVIAVAPSITVQPVDVSANCGAAASFSVTATGTTPLGYAWRKDGSPVAGATDATYTIPAVVVGDAGTYDCVVSNAGGSVTSNGAALTVNNVAPTADAIAPPGAAVCAGIAVAFQGSSPSPGPLAYQWFKDGQPIAGATGATLSIPSATLADAGQYTYEVMNACGAFSAAPSVTLTVDEAAEVTVQPVDVTACAGTPASFAVTATGTAPIAYQWRVGGTPIPGATSAALTFAAVTAADAGAYDCEVSNGCGTATSGFATLTVDEAAEVTVQPVDVTACAGTPASFAVTATGTAPIAYQWRVGGTPIPGATSAALTFAAVTAADAGAYDCEVSNGCGTATSGFATLTVDEAAEVTVQPVDVTACAGTPASFAVTATGTAPIAYQWRVGGTPIPGATSAALTFAAVTAADAGAYDCEVSNGCGTATSGFALLTVDDVAAIQTQPVDQTVSLGNTAVFSVAATSALPMAFQWRKDGAPISGPQGTGAVLSLFGVTLASAGSYDVEVTNSCGTVLSYAAQLTVADVAALAVDNVFFGLNPVVGVGDLVSGNGNDLVVATRNGLVQVLQNDGAGNFAALPPLLLGGNLADVVTGDFDGDGFVDVAVLGTTALHVLYGAGDGSFAPPITVATYAGGFARLAAAPLLAHTADDLVFTVGAGLWVAMNAANTTPGARGFDPPTLLQSDTAYIGVATGDITGDGRPDIITGDFVSTHIRVVDGATLAAFFDSAVATGTREFVVRDLDGDGVDDVALCTLSAVVMLRGPVLNTIVLDPTPASGIAAGNFDLGPEVDLVYGDAAGQFIVLHGAGAPGGPLARDVLSSPSSGTRLRAADLNRTGVFAGPAANTDELVLSRGLESLVIRFRGHAESTAIAGTGCGGTTPVAGVFGGAPVLGNAAFGSSLDVATPNALAMFAYQVHAPATAPLVLTPLGPCATAFALDQDLPILFAIVDGVGHAAVGLSVPSDPYLVGFEIPLQWVVFDNGPFVGLTLSPSLLLRLGEY